MNAFCAERGVYEAADLLAGGGVQAADMYKLKVEEAEGMNFNEGHHDLKHILDSRI